MHGIGDLVVVGEKVDEPGRFNVERWGAASLVLPSVPLSLIQKPILCRGDELLRGAPVVGIVRFVLSRERDLSGVVPIVVPDHVQAEAVAFDRAYELRELSFAFIYDDNFAS